MRLFWLAALAVGALAQLKSTEQAVYFSGSVAMADGGQPPAAVRIQRVCKGVARDEAWTDAKGEFTFKVTGVGDDGAPDSSQATRNSDLTRPIGNSTYYTNPVTTALRDCEVQAVLPGYVSDRVRISLKTTLDDTRLGTIVLHALTGAQALTVSATTLAAPSAASKAYEKGLAELRAKKWDAAEKQFEKAVAAYPRYAIAWFELGRLRENRGDWDGASKAWQKALEADARFERPYEGLAVAAEQKRDWAGLDDVARRWLALDAEGFPAAYLYKAISAAQMGRAGEAEAAARKGVALDAEHRLPRLEYVLGLILLEKGETEESAKYLRLYLDLAPNAKDAAGVRAQLQRMAASAARH